MVAQQRVPLRNPLGFGIVLPRCGAPPYVGNMQSEGSSLTSSEMENAD